MADDAADRLFAKGHRRIALLSAAAPGFFYEEFADQFRHRFAAFGGEPDNVVHLKTQPNEAGGQALTAELVGRSIPPTAFIVLTDSMTVGVYRALANHRLVPGKDVAVIGREGPDVRFLSPSLTYFRMPLRELGIEIAKGILTVTPGLGTTDDLPLRRLWPIDLVEGESDLNPASL